MTTKRSLRIITTSSFGWLGLLLIACGCHRHSDAALQERLVGTWSYGWSEGAGTPLPSDLTFTVTTNGGYNSQISIPQVHFITGTAKIVSGFLVIAATNRDNISVFPPMMDQQTLVQLNDRELATVSTGSSVTNHFRKQWPAGR